MDGIAIPDVRGKMLKALGNEIIMSHKRLQNLKLGKTHKTIRTSEIFMFPITNLVQLDRIEPADVEKGKGAIVSIDGRNPRFLGLSKGASAGKRIEILSIGIGKEERTLPTRKIYGKHRLTLRVGQLKEWAGDDG